MPFNNGSYISSRIPPPSSFSNPGTPRFHPPSYFAAAAARGSSNLTSANKSSYDYDSSMTNYMPNSYEEPAQSNSEPSRVRRRFSITSLKSNGTSIHSSSHKQQSQVEVLPSLEASLFPSLRDTVQRMTRPLSRSNPRTTGSTSTTSFDTTSLHSTELPAITTVSPSHSSARNSPDHLGSGFDYATKGLPITVSRTEPTPELKSKPSLKSALRTPKNTNIAGKYKRDDTEQEKPSSRLGHQDSLFAARPSRARSRTDPGTGLDAPATTSKVPRSNRVMYTSSNPVGNTLRTTSSSTRSEQPFPTPVKVQFGLPRRVHVQSSGDSDLDAPHVSSTKQGSNPYFRTPSRARLSRSIPSTPAPASSASDFEAMYAAEENKRRSKLIVTNADIASSSSTSSEEMPLNQRATKLRKPSSFRWGSSSSKSSTSSDNTSSFTMTNSPRTPTTRQKEEIGLGITLLAGGHAHQYGSTHDKRRQAKELNTTDSDELLSVKQRIALLGIVDGLGLRTPQSNRGSHKRMSQEDSASVVGLAISSSSDIKRHPHYQDNYDDQHDYHSEDGESDWREPVPVQGRQLPKSILDYYGHSHQTPNPQHQNQPQPPIPHANSDASLAGNVDRWDECDSDNENDGLGLSHGAEALFRNLNDRRTSRGRSSMADRDSKSVSTTNVLPPSESVPSIYDEEVDGFVFPAPAPAKEDFAFQPGPTKVATTPTAQSLETRPDETQRLSLFRTYLASETEYLSLLDSTISLFVLPLRIRETREWVSGVPHEIAQLFDWLEDIRNVHQRSFEALSAIIFQSSTEGMSESIKRTLLPGLEVYQPYLIQFDPVLKLVKNCLADKYDDFGQFTRLQECDTQATTYGNLETRLLEPIRKLSTYRNLFQGFLDATTKDDDDYVSTLCLVRVTDSVVRVMTEIKSREEEYTFVKNIESQLQGLPHALSLASRDRRLLANGSLSVAKLVRSDAKPVPGASQPPPPSTHSRKRSMLAEAVDRLERRRRSGLVSASSPTTHASDLSNSSAKRSQTGSDLRTSGQHEARFSELGLVQCFVFSDILIISDPSTWRVLSEIGACHILNVNVDTVASTIVLDVVPMINPNELQLNGSIRTIRLGIQDTEEAPAADHLQTWSSALSRCQRTTLNLMIMTTVGISVSSLLGSHSDDKLTSIIRSGMPFPKSPSMQVEGQRVYGDRDGRELEREARGWWSLQFEKVMKEMHSNT